MKLWDILVVLYSEQLEILCLLCILVIKNIEIDKPKVVFRESDYPNKTIFYNIFAVFVTPEVTQRKVSDSKLPCIEGKNPNLNHVTDVNEVYFLDHKLLEFRDFFQNYVLIPIKSSLNVLWHSPKRTLLLIQILNCTLYWFAMDEQNILYFYMTRRFEKFTGADFAMFIIAMKVICFTCY